jgi:5'-nucleotidase
VTGIEVTTVGSRPPGRLLPERAVDPRGVPYWWLRLRHDGIDFAPGTDLAAVRAGAISVSPLNPGLTHEPSLAQLRRLVRPVGSARSGCAGDAGPGRPDHEPAPRP